VTSLVLPFPETRHLVEVHAGALRPCGTEEASLLDARQRVLAETISADRDFPPFPRATRDGYAVYAADIHLPCMVHAKVLRAPWGHARIKRIDVSRAAALPGVLLAVTGQDLDVEREPTARHRAILAVDHVVFFGQPVAAVVAELEAARATSSTCTATSPMARAIWSTAMVTWSAA
jgi:xanthine dehydrogenase molybdopterin-binding subunit B